MKLERMHDESLSHDITLLHTGRTQEALQKLHKGLQQWPSNGYLALLAANLEAKQGCVANARRMYAVAAAHARSSTIAIQVDMIFKLKQLQASHLSMKAVGGPSEWCHAVPACRKAD